MSERAELGKRWKLSQALSGQRIDLPVTEFVPPQPWFSSGWTAAGRAHLVDWAVAVWVGDEPQIGARGICGARVVRPLFQFEEPEPDVLCDKCLLDGYIPPIVVYRFYDIDDRLLYVGCTTNLLERIGAHRNSELGWWPLAALVICVEFETQEAALRAEAEAIRTEHPLFNRTGRATAPRPARSRVAA